MAHILVVDDDDILAENAARILIDAGHACGWVTDTASATIALHRRRPDLVLLDQNMPRENGTSLLRRLRMSSRFYDLPVAMLTAVKGREEEQIAFYNGAQDYIRKPITERDLVYRVGQLLLKKAGRPKHRPLEELVNPRGTGGQIMAVRMV